MASHGRVAWRRGICHATVAALHREATATGGVAPWPERSNQGGRPPRASQCAARLDAIQRNGLVPRLCYRPPVPDFSIMGEDASLLLEFTEAGGADADGHALHLDTSVRLTWEQVAQLIAALRDAESDHHASLS